MAIGAGMASRLDKRVRIERPMSDEALDGAGSGSWHAVATVAASLVDALPSRGERLAGGINVAARPARLRMRYRTDVDASMRVLLLARRNGADVAIRTMQITAGPAEVGSREWSEFMVEDYTSAGNPN
jgi:head-tail adaptor